MSSTYGSAANGMAYRGRTIGSGYDCEVRLVRRGMALACVTQVSTGDEWMCEVEVEAGEDLQAMAERLAANPCLSDPDTWVADNEDEWDAMARTWNASLERAQREEVRP